MFPSCESSIYMLSAYSFAESILIACTLAFSSTHCVYNMNYDYTIENDGIYNSSLSPFVFQFRHTACLILNNEHPT
ncbi:hypothetical protein C0J52_02057 [Blattella germanica]|nr:hypothetical protein C0J52_02057 [Blattella germanica]